MTLFVLLRHIQGSPNWPQDKSSQTDSLSPSILWQYRHRGEGGGQAREGGGPNSKLHSCLVGALISCCASQAPPISPVHGLFIAWTLRLM